MVIGGIISRNKYFIYYWSTGQIRYKHASNRIFQGAGRVALTAVRSYTQKELNNHNFFKICNFLRATKCAE